MRRLNEERILSQKKHTVKHDIPIALEQILGIGRFDRVQPSMWIPCDNDEGGISVDLHSGMAVIALWLTRIIYLGEIAYAKLKKKLLFR